MSKRITPVIHNKNFGGCMDGSLTKYGSFPLVKLFRCNVLASFIFSNVELFNQNLLGYISLYTDRILLANLTNFIIPNYKFIFITKFFEKIGEYI